MINLIGNELKKIFKKKSIYITLFITLAFIIMGNVIYQIQSKETGYNMSSQLRFYEEQLAHLDKNSERDKSLYYHYKTEVDILKLTQKFGDSNTWQAQIIENQGRSLINNLNYYQYEEKNQTEYEKAKLEYEALVAKLEKGDWKYFAQEELKQVEGQIVEQKKLEGTIQDRIELQSIQNQIAGLEDKKQVLNWRLEKNICYGYDYPNTCLTRYISAKEGIRSYENSTDKEDYRMKQEYYSSLEMAAISKYDIENGTTSGNSSDARGILLDVFSQFEIFILIMIIMIAGSIVSEEFSRGTVKLLLIKPYKRSTILLSKFLTCVIVLLFIIVAIIGMQFIVGGIVQGFDSFSTPAVVYNHTTNQVEEIGIIPYLAMQTVGKLPIYLLLMTLAFAISTIFTNSALAITIGLLGYMGAPFINMLGQQFNLTWLKFFVTPNWDLTQYFFGRLPTIFEGLTPIFSIIVIIAYMLIMLIPTFVIFQKKNIKNI